MRYVHLRPRYHMLLGTIVPYWMHVSNLEKVFLPAMQPDSDSDDDYYPQGQALSAARRGRRSEIWFRLLG